MQPFLYKLGHLLGAQCLAVTPSPGREGYLDVKAVAGFRHQLSEDMSRAGTLFSSFLG